MSDAASRVKGAIEERIDIVQQDVGHALHGDLGSISQETWESIAGTIQSEMTGVSSIRIPVNDNVTVTGSKGPNGTVSVEITVKF